jgi:hypothetical protein
MKQLILILTFFFGSFSFVNAQNENKAEKVQALKIAFITQKLELTSAEAQNFWPVYNRYETDLRQVMKDNRGGGDAIDNEEKVLNVKKKYRTEFNRVIGPQKTNILFNAEREFRGVLMRQLKGKHGGKPE